LNFEGLISLARNLERRPTPVNARRAKIALEKPAVLAVLAGHPEHVAGAIIIG
jgi:hypothetical protein